jgi:hypothetical protein
VSVQPAPAGGGDGAPAGEREPRTAGATVAAGAPAEGPVRGEGPATVAPPAREAAAAGGAEREATRPMRALRRRAAPGRRRLPRRAAPDLDGGPPRARGGRALAILALLLAVVAVAVVLVARPFGSSHPSSSAAADNAVATSLAPVERRSISSQQTENGTLGYAGAYTVINQAGGGGGAEGSGGEKGGRGGGGGGRGTITALPAVGQMVREGEVLYDVNGEPVALLYGATPAYRTLHEGMSGSDVAELDSDLVALGYAAGAEIDEHPEYFGAETKAALRALQEKLGVEEAGGVKLGQLALGQAVFLPARTLRITSVSATLGGAAQQGSPIMQATSTRRQVVVKLDAAEQASVRKGDHVTITLPNNETTPGIVSSVGKVAKSGSSGGRGGGGEEEGTPTIEVQITPTDPRATGTLDQAPVRVAITTASARNALVVPVSALLALAEGGYAVEVAEGRSHTLVGVTLGLFDDADGRVQVSGSGLHAGQQVVVPTT